MMEKAERFMTYPFGAKNKQLHGAIFASTETSADLVSDEERDAFYFRSLEKMGVFLNKPQLEAVRHGQGPALVLAGAGSGKTRVLVSRTGYLLSVQKVDPKNILLVTFTKKASEEMKQRIASLPGLPKRTVNEITAGTFHSIFYRLLKSRGFDQQVISSEKQKQIAIKMILKRHELQDSYESETLLAILSSYKNNMKTVHDMPSKLPVEKEVKDVLTEYEGWKQERNYLDFDDMLLETYLLLIRDPQLLKAMQRRFQYILCDEWQDTNPIQYELIKMVANPLDHLFVVGDDDQTIFSFNGADSSIILNFTTDFPATKSITLDINYRSAADIVSLGNQVIKHNKMRHKKTLKASKIADQKPVFLKPESTDDEAKLIIKKIIDAVKFEGRRFKDFAILHRTATSSRAIFDQMVIMEVPFITFTRGETFYENSIVQMILDYLRLSLDPQNIAALRNILPSLYLNREKTIQYIETEAMFNPGKKLLDHVQNLPNLKDFQKKQINQRLNTIKLLQQKTAIGAIKEIRTFYDKYLEADERKTKTMDKEMIKETLAELESSAKSFKTVREYIGFIDEIITKNKEMAGRRPEDNGDVISLMTIHRSKGLEYPVIYLIGASETILPHSSALEADQRKDSLIPGEGKQKIACAIEEERRLAYVAITRAQEELCISSPSMYRGKQISVSRFLLEAYGAWESKKNISEMKIGRVKKGNESSERKSEIVHEIVWECTSFICNGWKRVSNQSKIDEEQKACPLCKSEMVKADREIKIYK
ncbi:UvrD-helicase domain-containing protein [Salipaludibacillus sp. HK11]|uniref:UvrD-helicase domain-containing protein n=1 Tax=Salipaludibacillus sp. HK11 TaxID=3394320 RepID=UPI0039FC1F87